MSPILCNPTFYIHFKRLLECSFKVALCIYLIAELLYKYFKICLVKNDGAYQIRFNPKMMETDILETNTRIYQRVFFTKGMIISYFDKELLEELCIDRYKNINAEMLFVNRINFSSIIKRFFFSCDVMAKELCSVLEQHTSNIITIIDSSFEEMIFKDSMYLYF